MWRKVRIFFQFILFQLTARSQVVSFDKLPFSNPLKTGMDSIFHEQARIFFKSSKAPGLIIGVIKQGQKQFYAYGFADTTTRKPMTVEMIVEIGSITKTFTSNLLFQAHLRKVLDIQKELNHFLPDNGKNRIFSSIKLADIATHTSGLPRLPSNLDKIKEYTLLQPYAAYKKEHLYSFLKSMQTLNPGKYEYSNLGFGLLSTILENEEKKTFEQLLKEHVWSPLAMTSTYIRSSIAKRNLATGYFYGKPTPFWEFDCLAGAGAIKSNAPDMLRYLDAHFQAKPGRLKDAITGITKPVRNVGKNMQICYGWHTLEDLKNRVFWHNGGTYGFCSFAAFDPVSRTAIFVVANAFNINSAVDKLGIDGMIELMGKK